MYPSELRAKILGEHAIIRAAIAELEALIGAVRTGTSGAAESLVRKGCLFLEGLVRHIERENQNLVPALREIDAWGEARADEVLSEHRDQVAEVEALLEVLGDAFTGGNEAADQLEAFLSTLAADMASEERLVLSPDVLRDDVVGIDVEAG